LAQGNKKRQRTNNGLSDFYKTEGTKQREGRGTKTEGNKTEGSKAKGKQKDKRLMLWA
jgi:hypothetical protein